MREGMMDKEGVAIWNSVIRTGLIMKLMIEQRLEGSERGSCKILGAEHSNHEDSSCKGTEVRVLAYPRSQCGWSRNGERRSY